MVSGVFSQSVSGGLNGIRGVQSVSGGLDGIVGGVQSVSGGLNGIRGVQSVSQWRAEWYQGVFSQSAEGWMVSWGVFSQSVED
jgi:hypothetical protein